MKSKSQINKLLELGRKPEIFEKGTGNIWTEDYIAKQMLKAHLDTESDGASREYDTIDKTIEFLNSIIEKNSRILDIGCGPGLYAERLCKNGHRVTGIDFSANTIKYAENSARKQNLNIEYRCMDMFNINFNNKYDVVMQIYGELNTFPNEERNKLFKIAYNSLKENGLFIFDVSTPIYRRKNKLEKNWYISDGGFWRGEKHIVLEEGFEYNDDIWLDQYIVIEDEEIKVYRNWFHDYTKETIEKIVLDNGFTSVKVLNGLMGENRKNEGDWLTIIAQK